MSKDFDIITDLFTQARDLDNNYRVKIVACVKFKKKIISYGFNTLKTHPFQLKHGSNELCMYWHAETRAIHNALKCVDEDTLKRCELYVARCRLLKHNHHEKVHPVAGIAKPCKNGCMECIKRYNMKRVIYSNNSQIGEPISYSVIEF